MILIENKEDILNKKVVLETSVEELLVIYSFLGSSDKETYTNYLKNMEEDSAITQTISKSMLARGHSRKDIDLYEEVGDILKKVLPK